MKLKFLPLAAALVLPAFAQDAAPAKDKAAEAPKKNPNATDFIRVHRKDDAVQLQTGITTYTKNGATLDLIGAVHIADAKYYKELNKQFTGYESLLFEMVGGDKMKNGKKPEPKEGEAEKPKDPMMAMLGNMYGMMGKFLNLQGQKEGIDYSPKNFVHADLSQEEFTKLQTEKGESLLGFAMQNAQKGQKPGAKQPDPAKLLTALMSGDSNGLKLEIVDSLGGGDDQVAGFAGNSVIIGDRNVKCLKVLAEQVKAGKKKIGIFYGAAHFPDMEERMLKDGWKKTNHRWLTAWDLKKAAEPKKAPAPKKAPVDIPDAA
ncbi:MAG: hypothetical protein ACPG32_12195 [Akkermansiaceae bacterium]